MPPAPMPVAVPVRVPRRERLAWPYSFTLIAAPIRLMGLARTDEGRRRGVREGVGKGWTGAARPPVAWGRSGPAAPVGRALWGSSQMWGNRPRGPGNGCPLPARGVRSGSGRGSVVVGTSTSLTLVAGPPGHHRPGVGLGLVVVGSAPSAVLPPVLAAVVAGGAPGIVLVPGPPDAVIGRPDARQELGGDLLSRRGDVVGRGRRRAPRRRPGGGSGVSSCLLLSKHCFWEEETGSARVPPALEDLFPAPPDLFGRRPVRGSRHPGTKVPPGLPRTG